ncbi:M28 family peptidase [Daejeonella lutea]|uniref:Peptidase family M28 n=1 Tax=Daejeonella lutea TaxID=572036 RepID=A0A1T5A3U0_9SPHI|nr:M28 family peptidase [Daejeonella lutea]SKB29644.1 Peptidase family M28 [Daejeonella lutea]
MMKSIITIFFLIFSFQVYAQKLDSLKLMVDLKELSSDKYQGRAPGTYGGRLAQLFLVNRFKEIGLKAYHEEYKQGVTVLGEKLDRKGPDSIWNFKQVKGANIIGFIPGKKKEVIVISAHYDHIGIFEKRIYNGADDNASGVAALLSMAEYFTKNTPHHTLMFAAFDAEELFMMGSMGFFKNLPIPEGDIVMNLNMDMIGTNSDYEMYAGGTHYYKEFKPMLRKIWGGRSNIGLRFGYDIPRTKDDRTFRSDHLMFHLSGIPFLYFGVPEHLNYHQTTDDYDNISHSFYYTGANLILDTLIELDRNFPDVNRRENIFKK